MEWYKINHTFRALLRPLRGAPIAVFVDLALTADDSGLTNRSVSEIQRSTGYSSRQVCRALRILEASGLLGVCGGDEGKRLVRRVHPVIASGSRAACAAPVDQAYASRADGAG